MFEDFALGLCRQTVPALVNIDLAIGTLEFLMKNLDQVIIGCCFLRLRKRLLKWRLFSRGQSLRSVRVAVAVDAGRAAALG